MATNQELINSISSNIERIYNKSCSPGGNLLINPDFKINQRGLSEYTTNGKYTCDRWVMNMHTASNTNKVIPNSTGGITLSLNAGNWIRISQLFENPIVDTITITLNIESALSGMRVDIIGKDNGSEVVMKAALMDENTTSLSVTYTPTSLALISINIRNNAGFGDIKLKNIKMEYGSIATSFEDPNPSIELTKCQRFYEKIFIVAKPLYLNSNELCGEVFRVPKRIAPSISITSFNGTSNTLSTVSGLDTSITLSGTPGATTINIPTTTWNYTFPNTTSYIYYCIADAEIY